MVLESLTFSVGMVQKSWTYDGEEESDHHIPRAVSAVLRNANQWELFTLGPYDCRGEGLGPGKETGFHGREILKSLDVPGGAPRGYTQKLPTQTFRPLSFWCRCSEEGSSHSAAWWSVPAIFRRISMKVVLSVFGEYCDCLSAFSWAVG